MRQQFENEETKKLNDKTVPDAETKQKINELAEKSAEKASKTEQRYDEHHTIISK